MAAAKTLSFTVPAVKEEPFLLELYDGTVYSTEIPEHIAAGQRIVASLEEDSIMLEYFHTEGEAGLPSGGDKPKIVIGRRVEGEAAGPKVFAETNKHVSFEVPSAEECLLKLDDGRVYQVSMPEHVAAGQTVAVSVEGTDVLLSYYHSEGEFKETEKPKVCIGSQVKPGSSDVATIVMGNTLHPRHLTH